jgi:hypothetical protein
MTTMSYTAMGSRMAAPVMANPTDMRPTMAPTTGAA